MQAPLRQILVNEKNFNAWITENIKRLIRLQDKAPKNY